MRHHLCGVQRSGLSIPNPVPYSEPPPSRVDADADVDGAGSTPSQLLPLSARGRGNLRVNLSEVLHAESRSGRLSLIAVGTRAVCAGFSWSEVDLVREWE